MKNGLLIVAMNGIVVGELHRHKSGAMSFQYVKSWLNESGSRAISYSLPLREDKYDGDVVINFFNNLLPDSAAVIARMQARFSIKSAHPFDILATIGRDCIGAIQLYLPDSEILPPTIMKSTPLNEAEIESIIDNYQASPLGMIEGTEFRISLAGAQEKTALLWYQDCWQRPENSTPTSHIFKLPIGLLEQHNIDLSDSCENEWLSLRIIQAFGLPVAHAELATFGRKKVLIVERFDRKWSRDGRWLMRLPQEDLCQALGISPALKYESDGGPSIADAMKLLLGSRKTEDDRHLFFQAQIIFWMLAAIDGHGKNFSIFIEPESSFQLTPLYDVISAYPIFSSGAIQAKKATMAMALLGKNRQYKWSMIQPRHFLTTAEKIGFSAKLAKSMMIALADKTDAVIANVREILPDSFPQHISEPIFEGLLQQAKRIKNWSQSIF